MEAESHAEKVNLRQPVIAGQKTGQPKAFPKLGAQGRSILISFSFLLLIFWQDTPRAKPNRKSREQEPIDSVPRVHHGSQKQRTEWEG